jgi:hypothetical protein
MCIGASIRRHEREKETRIKLKKEDKEQRSSQEKK